MLREVVWTGRGVESAYRRRQNSTVLLCHFVRKHCQLNGCVACLICAEYMRQQYISSDIEHVHSNCEASVVFWRWRWRVIIAVGTPSIPTDNLHCFLQYLQANVGIVLKSEPRLILSIPFSSSLFRNHPLIERCAIWATSSFRKWRNKQLCWSLYGTSKADGLFLELTVSWFCRL
jgi:hypothetical protein